MNRNDENNFNKILGHVIKLSTEIERTIIYTSERMKENPVNFKKGKF